MGESLLFKVELFAYSSRVDTRACTLEVVRRRLAVGQPASTRDVFDSQDNQDCTGLQAKQITEFQQSFCRAPLSP